MTEIKCAETACLKNKNGLCTAESITTYVEDEYGYVVCEDTKLPPKPLMNIDVKERIKNSMGYCDIK